MATPQDVIGVARSQIGYVETPTNVTKYWADLLPRFQGEPWCAVFISWCFRKAGAPLPAAPWSFGYTYVGGMTDLARKNGWVIPGPRPGAIVNYGTAHTEVCTSIEDGGGNFGAIGGNTSSGAAGSQVNGGGVYARTRNVNGSGIGRCVFIWPPVFTGQPSPAPLSTEVNDVAVFIKTDDEGLFVTNGVSKRWVRDKDDRAALVNTGLVPDFEFGIPKNAFEAIPTQPGGGAPSGSTKGK